ncbi:hypothetical protein Kim5_PB00121 (plasmid) [Rhizobium sp. Kim5]|nr:hypothetical protein Kim5_PB00121 [Rhizobium sp. Kim5]
MECSREWRHQEPLLVPRLSRHLVPFVPAVCWPRSLAAGRRRNVTYGCPGAKKAGRAAATIATVMK